jgi:hypothetical protein
MEASERHLKHLRKVHAARRRQLARMTLDERRALTAAAREKMTRAFALLAETEEKRAG